MSVNYVVISILIIIFKVMFMWLMIIFLFPDRLPHTGIASIAKPKMGSFTLWVRIYDPLFLVSTIRKMRCPGCPGGPGNGHLARENFSIFYTYINMT